MATTKPRAAGRTAPAPSFGKITVARYREGLRYLTVAVDRLRDSYIDQTAAFRLAYTEGTAREPTAQELAPVAAGLGIPLDKAAKQVKAAGLSAHEEPDEQTVMLASLIGAAPEALDGFLGLYALLAMDKDEFEEARENERLADAVTDAVRAMDDEPMEGQREKAVAAWEAMASTMGYAPGKGWALLVRSALMALTTATSASATLPSTPSIDSPAPTDGPGEPSSTTPDGGKPST